MQYIDFDLAASASAVQNHVVEGNYLKYVEESTGTGNKIVISTDNGQKIILKPGRGVALAHTFKRLKLEQFNGAALAISGTLSIGADGERIDDSLVVGSVTSITTAAPGTQVTSVGAYAVGNAATLLGGGANTARRMMVLQADKNNPEVVYLGGSTVGLATGISLDPGEKLILVDAAATVPYYAIAATAAVNNIRIMDVR
jgi:hypothetical protein